MDLLFGLATTVFLLLMTWEENPMRAEGLWLANGGGVVGFLWGLIQQSEINRQGERAATLEGRVAALEQSLEQTNELVQVLLQRLEHQLGKDLDGDGIVGPRR
jgi:hypothetical protein